MSKAPTTVIFDVGGVVLDWRPRAAFAQVLDDEAIGAYFAEIDFAGWNLEQDGGRSWAAAEAQLASDFPHYAHLATTYRQNFHRTIESEINGTAEVLVDLSAVGVRLLALTNFSDELFAVTYPRFPVLQLFDGIVVSGTEGLVKPDPEIFRLLLRRYRVEPGDAVFVDDTEANVDAAEELGLRGVHFTDAHQLRRSLRELGLPLGSTATPPPGG